MIRWSRCVRCWTRRAAASGVDWGTASVSCYRRPATTTTAATDVGNVDVRDFDFGDVRDEVHEVVWSLDARDDVHDFVDDVDVDIAWNAWGVDVARNVGDVEVRDIGDVEIGNPRAGDVRPGNVWAGCARRPSESGVKNPPTSYIGRGAPVFVHGLGIFVIVREWGKSEGFFDGAQQAVVVAVVIGNECARAHSGRHSPR